MRENEKKRYKVFPIRLNEITIKKLKQERIKTGLSWNLFIFELLNAYYANGNTKGKTK